MKVVDDGLELFVVVVASKSDGGGVVGEGRGTIRKENRNGFACMERNEGRVFSDE